MEFEKYKEHHRKECIEVFDSNLGKYFDDSERDEFIKHLDSLTESSGYYVCTNEDKVIACGGMGNGSNVGSLCWGMVHKKFHKKGIGKKLTTFRVNLLKSNPDIDIIKIETSQHTENFYMKQGFITTKVIENGFGDGINCVSMELNTDTKAKSGSRRD